MVLMIDNLPESIMDALETRARAEGRTVREIAAEAIERGLRLLDPPRLLRDFSDIVGTMTEEDARIIEETVKWMDDADLASRQMTFEADPQ